MPKKFGTNTKKQEANERKQQVKEEKLEKEIQKLESEYWKETDDKINKKLQREKEKEEKRLEQIKRKKENKEFVEKEQDELESEMNNKKKPVQTVTGISGNSKEVITKSSATQSKEDDLKKLAEKFEIQQKSNSYANEEIDVDQEYVNKNFLKMEEYQDYIKNDINLIEGSGIDSAINSLDVNTTINHPEKKMKAAWKAFVEKNLPDLKKQNPKFKRSKLLDMLSKEFHNSTENPMVVFKIQKQKELLKEQLKREMNPDEEEDED